MNPSNQIPFLDKNIKFGCLDQILSFILAFLAFFFVVFYVIKEILEKNCVREKNNTNLILEKIVLGRLLFYTTTVLY